MRPRWWEKKFPSMESSAKKFNLGKWSIRPSMPYGARGSDAAPERCLMFASISVRMLIVTCIRSCFTSCQQKGRVAEDDVRTAMMAVFDGLLLHLPLDRLGFPDSLRTVRVSVQLRPARI